MCHQCDMLRHCQLLERCTVANSMLTLPDAYLVQYQRCKGLQATVVLRVMCVVMVNRYKPTHFRS